MRVMVHPVLDALFDALERAGVPWLLLRVPVTPRAIVEAIYRPSRFVLAHVSVIVMGERSGTRRHLYRSVDAASMRACGTGYGGISIG